MLNRVLFVLGGVSFCGLGYSVLTRGGWHSFKLNMFIQHGDSQIPVGILMISIGVILIFYSIFGKWKPPEIFTCPKCEKTVELNEKQEAYCTDCKVKMEPLKGFYEKHPDK